MGIGVLLLLLVTACGRQQDARLAPQGSSVTVLQTTRGLYKLPRWSPDGQAIGVIFFGDSSVPPYRIIVLDATGQRTHAIDNDQYSPANPFALPEALAWHPDGSLWMGVDLRTREELGRIDRFALASWTPHDPAAPIKLQSTPIAPFHDLDWSPDGTTLLTDQRIGPAGMMGNARPTGISAFRQSPPTWTQWQAHDTFLAHPRWSPAGDAVVYVASTAPGTIMPVESELVVRSWGTQAVQRVTPEPGCSYIEPSWSPDGTHLLYREVCNNPRGKRADHLVVSRYPAFDDTTEVCDGQSLANPDRGPTGTVVAVTIGVPGENNLVVCTIHLP